MIDIELSCFTADENFPFFIQYGEHIEDLYIHAHKDFSELVIVLSGSAVHIVDDEEFNIKKGDVFVISNDTRHGYKKTKNFKICNIMYQPEKILAEEYDIKKSAGFYALFVLEPYVTKEHHFCNELKLNTIEFNRVCSITNIMLDEYINKKDGWQTVLKSSFMNLVVILSRLYSFTNRNLEKYEMINLAQTLSYIENHYNEDISIDTLADISHYSHGHFIRIFRALYHITPLEYIITLRISHAAIMLRETNIPVSDIAIKCGFSGSNYFGRTFKKHFGISPTQFRMIH